MKEIVVTQYVAEDGKKFETKEKCITYEERRKEIFELRKTLRKIKDICDNTNCQYCPFNDDDTGCRYANYSGFPTEWIIPED